MRSTACHCIACMNGSQAALGHVLEAAASQISSRSSQQPPRPPCLTQHVWNCLHCFCINALQGLSPMGLQVRVHHLSGRGARRPHWWVQGTQGCTHAIGRGWGG